MILTLFAGGIAAVALADTIDTRDPLNAKDGDDSDSDPAQDHLDAAPKAHTEVEVAFSDTSTTDIELAASVADFVAAVDPSGSFDAVHVALGTTVIDAPEPASDLTDASDNHSDIIILEVTNEDLARDPVPTTSIDLAIEDGDQAAAANDDILLIALPEGSPLYAYVTFTQDSSGDTTQLSGAIYLSESDALTAETVTDAKLIATLDLGDATEGGEDTRNFAPAIATTNGVQAVFVGAGLEANGASLESRVGSLDDAAGAEDTEQSSDSDDDDDVPFPAVEALTIDAGFDIVGAPADAADDTSAGDAPPDAGGAIGTDDNDVLTTGLAPVSGVDIDGNDGDEAGEEEDGEEQSFGFSATTQSAGITGSFEPGLNGADTYTLDFSNAAFATRSSLGSLAPNPAVLQNLDASDTLTVTVPEDLGYTLHAVAITTFNPGTSTTGATTSATLQLYFSPLSSPTPDQLLSGGFGIQIATIGLGGPIDEADGGEQDGAAEEVETDLIERLPTIASNIPVGLRTVELRDEETFIGIEEGAGSPLIDPTAVFGPQ